MDPEFHVCILLFQSILNKTNVNMLFIYFLRFQCMIVFWVGNNWFNRPWPGHGTAVADRHGVAEMCLAGVRLGVNTRWCNGNTRDFGSLVQGSNPCRVVYPSPFSLPISVRTFDCSSVVYWPTGQRNGCLDCRDGAGVRSFACDTEPGPFCRHTPPPCGIAPSR